MFEPSIKPIEWLDQAVRIIDQRELPGRECHLDLTDAQDVAEAIRSMALRGAPLIGIAAAMGVALESRLCRACPPDQFRRKVETAIQVIGGTRPTAVNLFSALKRMGDVFAQSQGRGSPQACSDALVREALAIYDEDLQTGIKMGETGVGLIKDGFTVLTHCNAGGLATSGFGTALAPMYLAHRRAVRFKVFADETRPLFQGARLTAWELSRAGIDVTVICDSACHLLVAEGKIDLVLVGSDRIALNGDFANKIGTYGIAVSAKRHGVPFYVVAPTSTIDFALESGKNIPIEQRDPSEVTHIAGKRMVPEDVAVFNPAFDVTPAELASGFITERGLITPPFAKKLAHLRG